MKVDLNGNVALVTGAGRHIGRAIADALASNGATVVYTDIDEATAREAAAQSPGHAAGRAESARLDVTNEAAVNAAVAGVVARHGRLDIVVNNAGVNTSAHRVTVEQFPKEEWDRILQVDLTGLYLVSKAAAGVMVTQGRGKIINIGSVMGLVPARLQCAFTAAKAGVVNLTRAMAIELGGRGVLVNCVAPGSILTEGTKQLFYDKGGQFNDKMECLLAHIPLSRPGSCEEIAHAVLFLAAPESSYITGQTLAVDGGWTAGYFRDF
ncbi:MAG: SDR family NAD(P)-dependent oxidoreductase [Planctomycetota bacterium]|nr:SDR family NAD(P)-dependent oxidoreductase [Planctomycetota bacterium]